MEKYTHSFTKYFLPNYFRIIGLVLIIVAIIILFFAALLNSYLVFFPVSHTVTMFNRLVIVAGLSLIIFSKEKSELEETDKIRLNSLIFSIAAGVVILLVFEVVNILNSQVPLDAVDYLIVQMCIYYIFFKMSLKD